MVNFKLCGLKTSNGKLSSDASDVFVDMMQISIVTDDSGSDRFMWKAQLFAYAS